jgi:imidazoleglycerol phosphate synthase glutamine amidotransferase subunit HisH
MTGILDYGVGNLFSLKSSFAAIGEETVVSADPGALAEADRLVREALAEEQQVFAAASLTADFLKS